LAGEVVGAATAAKVEAPFLPPAGGMCTVSLRQTKHGAKPVKTLFTADLHVYLHFYACLGWISRQIPDT